MSTLTAASVARRGGMLRELELSIGRKLDANGSPYATAFQLLEALSPVEAQELAEPPVIYGRTAMIDFETSPAIALLEISAPFAPRPVSYAPTGTRRGTGFGW